MSYALWASSAPQATSPLGTSLYLHLSLGLANSCPGAFMRIHAGKKLGGESVSHLPGTSLLFSHHGCEELMFGLDHLTALLYFPTLNDSMMSFHLSYTTLHPCPAQDICLLISLFDNSSFLCTTDYIHPFLWGRNTASWHLFRKWNASPYRSSKVPIYTPEEGSGDL